MMLSNYERLRSAAREYSSFQGLRMIPFGLFLLALAPRSTNSNWLGGQGDCTFTTPLLLLAIIAWFLLGQYYKRTFGSVTPRLSPNHWLVEAGLLVLLAVSVILENVIYRMNQSLSISFIGLSLAALYLVTGNASKRWHYILFGGILFGVSFLPVFTGTTVASPLYGTFGLWSSMVVGLGVILTGLIDHIRMVKYFPPLEGANNVRAE